MDLVFRLLVFNQSIYERNILVPSRAGRKETFQKKAMKFPN